ncbi:hypothetical protein, partial [Shewanella algae]|uniref:hypothetical protein n=1 Tax=Shewanella algae TaxID=38313 RepID=UPI00313C5A5F
MVSIVISLNMESCISGVSACTTGLGLSLHATKQRSMKGIKIILRISQKLIENIFSDEKLQFFF